MSVSSLPEWKQLLLEKKRREEEERERREKEEEAKFASMPAWKRGIIQRRKAKQDSLGDKEKDRDVSSQVSVETIVPVHENPFIRTQSAKRKGRDAEAGTEQEAKERDKDKSSPRSQEVESGRGRDIEIKKERFRDLSEGREMERSRDRSQGREQEKPREGWEKDKSQWKDSAKDQAREQELLKVRKEETETDPLNNRFRKDRDKHCKNKEEKGGPVQRKNDSEVNIKHRSEVKKVEAFDIRAAEKDGDVDGDEGFTVASVKNTEGISFARRLPIRQDGRTRAERETKQVKGQTSSEKELIGEKDSGFERQAEKEEDQETSESNPPHRACSPSSRLKPTNQTITVKASLIRSQSPDNTLKPSGCTPTPACSPSSQSPAQSPSVSPSTTPSPTLFSIRSASGGQVKRGATITISARKTTGAQTTSAVAEPVKKKYPTVEEIEVIGGYQNLDKSCLVKIRGTPKRGKVYFDEDQLEQLCEYPSETSMLASTPFPHDLWRTEKPQGEEVQEEEAEVEGGAMVSKSTRNVGISTGRGLIVGQCHPFLKKHKV
uniref:Phostensin/Taperin PP1-binding domain-containing protein n=1 Tax=Labrus bergylta TaxID=56723 RepID=A0A3Q3ENS3_9LABR